MKNNKGSTRKTNAISVPKKVPVIEQKNLEVLLERERMMNVQLNLNLTNLERVIMSSVMGLDFGGKGSLSIKDVMEATGYVPASTGTRFGEGVNDTSIDESRDTVNYTNNQAWKAFIRNPYAKRQVKTVTSHVVGKGYSVWSDSHQVQAIINQTMANESNRMALALRERVNRYQIEGMVCMYLTCLAPWGETLIREIPTAEVYEIAVDPGDTNRVLGIIRYFKRREWVLSGTESDYLSPGQYEENPVATYVWIPAFDWDNPPKRNTTNAIHDLVFVSSPTLSNRTRGLSDFASHLSWLNRLEKLGIARTVLNILRASIVWLHSVKGDPGQIATLRASIESAGTPPPGSSKVINSEVEKFEPLAPKLEASDAKSDTQLVRGFSVAGSGLSEQLMTGDYGQLSFAGGKQASRDLVRNLEEPQSMHEDGERRIYMRSIKAAVHYGTIKPIKIKIPKDTNDMNQIDISEIVELGSSDREFLKKNIRVLQKSTLAKRLGVNEAFIDNSMREFDRDRIVNAILKVNEAVSGNGDDDSLPPTYARTKNQSSNQKNIDALEKCIKRENLWRSPRVNWVEVIPIWDDRMKTVLKYVALKINGFWVDKNLYELIQIKFPYIQVEDQLAHAQALTLDITNKLVSRQTASQVRGYDPDVEDERMLMDEDEPVYGEPDPGKKPKPETKPEPSEEPEDDKVVKPPKPRDPKSPRSAKPEKDYV